MVCTFQGHLSPETMPAAASTLPYKQPQEAGGPGGVSPGAHQNPFWVQGRVQPRSRKGTHQVGF